MPDINSPFTDKGKLKTREIMEKKTEQTKEQTEEEFIQLGIDVDEVDQEIDGLVKKKTLEFLKIDPTHIRRDMFHAKLQQVRVGMEYKRDREKARIANNGQVIQLIKLLTSNESERRKYISRSMPGVKLISPPTGTANTVNTEYK